MTTSSTEPVHLSALDADLLRIETPSRPMHWCFLIKLRANATDRITLADLRERIAQRAARHDIFSITVTRRRFRTPHVVLDEQALDPSAVVTHAQVQGIAPLRLLLASMMATFDPTARLWEVTLIDEHDSGEQYLAVRVHHCLGDGLSASGFAYLFVDGNDQQLAQFDRYLTTPRFRLEPIDRATMLSACRHLARTWAQGRGYRRAAPRPTSSRLVNYLEISAAEFNQAARAIRATQTEYLLASVSQSMGRLARGSAMSTVRTMIPMTLDTSLRHTGNAMAFALVNLPVLEPSFDATLADVRTQIDEIAREKPHYALPTLTQQAAGPWMYKTLASRAIMTAVRPDLDVGLTPLHVTMDQVLGVDVAAVYPFSPLVYTPISVAAVLLGGQLTVGITTDAAVVGGLGEALAAELATRLTAHAHAAVV